MTPRAALAASLPQAAQAFLSPHIDPADAFISWHAGLTPAQARSRARNSARGLGTSWPDRLPHGALIDPKEIAEIQQQCGLRALSPDEIIEAVEQAEAVLGGPEAALRLAQADTREVDTLALSKGCGISRRRAQQIKKARGDLAKRQLPLFICGEDEEGSAK